ncbi:hypothetical protein MF672_042125 [Actinomadura sp. ATCC 31491]|uniref:Secreted protein n=1 Tax=Actinomadura luzonensis TaxID=2805427 RepID=A0ABT0G6X5_9ACTN|nr:hypothetical protein [Actinomadura luzonensis]MCK2220356.1 hypothetical protein [Actinomadura luzonensis]
MNRHLRTLLGVTATAAIAVLGVPALGGPANAATNAATTNAVTTNAVTTKAAAASAAQARHSERPFLFTYTFDNHLKVAGGYFTVGGRVYVTVRYSTGRVAFGTWTTARTHPVTPGGAVYVGTTVAAPCYGGPNGYAQAYDAATRTWSPRLAVTICQRID